MHIWYIIGNCNNILVLMAGKKIVHENEIAYKVQINLKYKLLEPSTKLCNSS